MTHTLINRPFKVGDRVVAKRSGESGLHSATVTSVRWSALGQIVDVSFDYDAESWIAPDENYIQHAPTAEAEAPKSSDSTLADLRALATRHDPTIDVSMPPSVLLALLDRVERAEVEVERLAGSHGGSLKAVCNERDAYADALDAYQAGAVPSPETGRLRASLTEAESTIARLTAERDAADMSVGVCDAIAMADTAESAAHVRAGINPKHRSAALDSVMRRVDECIRLRADVTRLTAENGTLRVIAEQEIADAIVRSKERATRIYWVDYTSGQPCEVTGDWPANEMSIANEVCAFFRMLRVWWLTAEAEVLRALAPRLAAYAYGSGCSAGHEDTVEGRYCALTHAEWERELSKEGAEIAADFMGRIEAARAAEGGG